jgi:multiple sugar transport system permease protein
MATAAERRRAGYFRWAALLPLILMLAFLLPVFLLQIYMSLTQWTAYLGPWWMASWVGLDLFKEVLTEGRFYLALWRSFLFAALSTAISLFFGFIVAWLLHKPFRGRSFYYMMFITPMLIVPVVTGYNFQMILLQGGPINDFISRVFGFDFQLSWLGDPTAAFVSLVLIESWNWTPFVMIIMLAGFVSMPKEPIEAARVLGASRTQVFFHVMLPLLRPILVLSIILRFLEALAEFPKVNSLTQGGPGTSTETMPVYLFLTSWEHFNVSKAVAMSYVVLVIVGIVIYFSIRALLQQKRSLDVMFANTGN